MQIMQAMTTTAAATAATTTTTAISSTALPQMGLGMAALGRPGYITIGRQNIFGSAEQRTIDQMQSQANLVMDELFALSSSSSSSKNPLMILPWLDCARSYGLSEQFVGEYLRNKNIAPNQVYVSSKWGYTYVADFKVTLEKGAPHEIKDHSTANFLKQVQETKEYLGDYLDLYQIHSATFESGILTDKKAHEALASCRDSQGWAIGLSVSGTKQGEIVREALKIRVPRDDDNGSVRLFDSVQCTYNVLEQSAADALMEAREAGLDIIIKEGLANGRAMQNEVIKKYSTTLGCQPDQLALACILAQPFRPRVLSGAVTPEQLSSNFKAMELAEKLKDGTPLLEEIMNATCMDPTTYWSERSALPWN